MIRARRAWKAMGSKPGVPNWHDLLPRGMATEQTAWERRALICRARQAGAPVKIIAQKMGVCTKRIYQIIAREHYRPARHPPIALYFSGSLHLDLGRRKPAAANALAMLRCLTGETNG